MLILHLARHGDTTQSADGTFCGDLDPPLTEKGKQQADKLARVIGKLGVSAMYVSPRLRARMTADSSSRVTGIQPKLDEGLREISYGTWEGRKEAEIREHEPRTYWAWVTDPALVSPPGGESAFAIAARALPVILRIREAHGDESVVFFSHKATIRVITCALLGLPLGRFRDRISCPTASLTSFEFGDRGAMLVRIGDTSHLQD
jgi:broad specificity phosphatase PhoE